MKNELKIKRENGNAWMSGVIICIGIFIFAILLIVISVFAGKSAGMMKAMQEREASEQANGLMSSIGL